MLNLLLLLRPSDLILSKCAELFHYVYKCSVDQEVEFLGRRYLLFFENIAILLDNLLYKKFSNQKKFIAKIGEYNV